jgi:hypothetical protein
MRQANSKFRKSESGIFCATGLEHGKRLDELREIRNVAQGFRSRFLGAGRCDLTESELICPAGAMPASRPAVAAVATRNGRVGNIGPALAVDDHAKAAARASARN